MAEIDSLKARVEADTLRAKAALKDLDRTADEAAEDRVGVVKILIDDDGIDTFEKRSNRRGGLLGRLFGGGLIGGDNDVDVFDITDGLGNLTGGLDDLAKAGGDAGNSMSGLGGTISGMGPQVAGMGGNVAMLGAKLVLILPAIAAAGSGLVALGGAAAGLVAALSPLVGLLGVLPGMFLGIGGAIGVLMGAFSGVTEAIGEQDAATKDAEKANRAYERSLLGVQSAEVGLERASRSFANARRDAAEAIEDAQFAAESAQLSEERAILGLERAYKRLTDVQSGLVQENTEVATAVDYFTGKTFEIARITYDAASSQDDLRDAQLGVREAELSLAMARDQREDSELNLLDLQSRGIAQSDILIDRTLQLAAAEAALADANSLVEETQKGLLGQGEAYNELTEAGQEFVDMILELKPLWEEFKDTMQDTLMPFATQALEDLKPLLEELGELLTPVAEAIGQMFGDIAETVGSETFIDKLGEFFDKHAGHIEQMGTMFSNLTMGLMNLTLAAEPLANFLVEKGVSFSEQFLAWSEGDSEMGDLTKWFELTAEVLDKVLNIIGDLWVGMTGFVEAAEPFGGWLLDSMGDWTQDFRDFTTSAEGQNSIAEFFERLKEPLSAIADLIGAIGGGMVEVFGSPEAMAFLTDFTNMLTDEALPILFGFFDMLIKSGFLSGVVNLLGSLVTLFASFAEFKGIESQAKVLGFVLDLFAGIVDIFALFLNMLSGLSPEGFLWDFSATLLDGFDLEGTSDAILEWVEGLPGDIASSLDGLFDGMWDGIVDAFEGAINSIIEAWNGLSFTLPGVSLPGVGEIFGATTIGIPSALQIKPIDLNGNNAEINNWQPTDIGTYMSSRVPGSGSAQGGGDTYIIDVDTHTDANPYEISDAIVWNMSGGKKTAGGGGGGQLVQ